MELGTTLNFTPFLSYLVEGTLYVSVLLFIIFSLILGYHVKQYSLNTGRAVSLFLGYVVGGVLITISMLTAFMAL